MKNASADSGSQNGWLIRAIGVRTRLNDLMSARRGTIGRVAMGLAAVIFAVGLVVSWRSLPSDAGLSDSRYLAIVGLVLTPATVVLNAVRFDNSARVLGRRVSFIAGMRVSVLASAANLLPLPGAALVRVAGLTAIGSSLGPALSSTGVVAGAWAAVTGIISGAYVLVSGHVALGLALLAGGLTAAAVSGWLLMQITPHRGRSRVVLRIVLAEVAILLVAAARLYCVLGAIQIDASFGDAMALTVAGVLASAVGFFPGGLGIRELFSAAIAAQLSLAPSAGFVVAAVDRLIGLLVLAPISLYLAVTARRVDGKTPSRSGSPDSP